MIAAGATGALVLTTLEQIFRDQIDVQVRERATAGEFPAALFEQLQQQGMLALSLPGQDLPEQLLFAALELAGRYAVPLPLAEHLLAVRWLGSEPQGLVSLAAESSDGSVLAPWGRQAAAILCLDLSLPDPAAEVPGTGRIQLLAPEQVQAQGVAGLQLEPWDWVQGTRQQTQEVTDPLLLLALARAAQMCGALQTVLALAQRYASERVQFGRPLARFQAIQHQLAVLAAEVAAAQAATAGAVAELGSDQWPDAAAAAKIRTGMAAGVVAEIAHQVHGAMGYTREHELHQFTLRLLCWRDDYGHEAEWQEWLGARMLASGADGCWPRITGP